VFGGIGIGGANSERPLGGEVPRSYREPEYRRRVRERTAQQERDTATEKREAAEKDYREKLTAAVHRVEQELNRSNDEADPQKKRIRCWEKSGVIGLWAAAAVGVGAVWFGTYDASQQRGVTQRQLTEMQTDSAIRRAELEPKIRISLALPPGNFGGWAVQTEFVNTGKTDAIDFIMWDTFKVFDHIEDVKNFDFINKPADIKTTEPQNIIPNDPHSFPHYLVTIDQAWNIMYERSAAVVWGYVEHKDEFGRIYTIHHCQYLHFTFSLNVAMNLPVNLRAECNRRTLTERTAEKKE
jgi:hypothetical protein